MESSVRAKKFIYIAALFAICLTSLASTGLGDVIIDNEQAGTTSTGSWLVSGASGFYGTDSLWARDGATYTWTMSGQPAGTYEVLMWWSPYSSRATSVNTVITHAGGQETLTINQQENGGQWNSLGTFTFDGTGSVRITAANGSSVSTCADAVWFKLIGSINVPPTATIDSITPNPADLGQMVQFTGHGTDSDGIIAAYNWESNIDGALSDANSFSTAVLSAGVHIISFEVQDNNGAWSDPVTQNLTIGETPTEIIIDNGTSNTSSTGTWQISGATGAYGTNSVWSHSGATYTWTFTPSTSGTYTLSMWWTELSSRSSSVPVSIQHNGGTANTVINQTQNGGKWNIINSYTFTAGTPYNVTITAPAGSPPSTCADAVKFTLTAIMNTPPVATIDSITPNPAQPGQAVEFRGYGIDTDGTIAAYNWESTIDGHLSDANSFSTSALSEGVHTIIFEVQDDDGEWSTEVLQTLTVGNPPAETIIDNGDAATSSTGSWEVSGAPDAYGTNSVWSYSGATYTWTFTPATSGVYRVSMWWTALSTRSSSVPVSIENNSGTANININQQQNGGTWNELGEYQFDAGTAYDIMITAPAGSPPSTCADAVKFTLITVNNAPVATIDSILPNPATEGQSVQFKGHGSDTDGTIQAYRWQSNIDGNLSDANWFSTNTLSEGSHTITFEVQDNAGMWSQPMSQILAVQVTTNVPPTASITSITPNPATQGQTVSFTGSGTDTDGTITAYRWESNLDGSLSSASSFTKNNLSVGSHTITFTVQDDDGAWSLPVTRTLVIQQPANIPPTATIISISPSPAAQGQSVSFVGSGTDTDGTITAYRWTSSINGVISSQASFSTTLLSPGTHTISFKVKDNRDDWSSTVTWTLTINALTANIISDNGGSGTSSTGTWRVSGGSNPYGTNSLYSSNGATYTWSFTAPTTGNYQVYLWWTALSSRSSSVPYAIQRNGGTTTVTVNQRQNGGKWNSAGTFAFTAGQTYTIKVTAQSSSYNSCADAVRWQLGGSSSSPTAQITSILPSPAAIGQTVEFCGAGFDSDGTIQTYEWTSNINGAIGSASTFTTSSLSAGTHTISLRVQDNSGNWSSTVTAQLIVSPTINVPPTATITSITPNPASLGQTVDFAGTGTDTDGTVTAYKWESSIDGILSTQSSFSKSNLSAGTHTISFSVQDNLGAWSQTVTRSLAINETVADIIIDNGNPNCTYTNSSSGLAWGISGATGFYGMDSYWNRDGATYTWRVTPTVSANYEVFAWWSAYPTRSTSVPIDIVNAGGTNRVNVNQQINGGQWNSLGIFPFQAGITYNITVTAVNGSTVSTCADAVKLTHNGPINIQLPPVAEILSITPNPSMPNQTIVFKGKATDGDGTVTAYRWRSNIDGIIGTTSTLNKILTAGTHTIYFTAQDNSGSWAPEVSATVDVGLEHIYIALAYGGNEMGSISMASLLQSMGATQLSTYEWRYTTPTTGKIHYIHFVRNLAGLAAGMIRDGAHIIIATHSNYGLGPIFSTPTEDVQLMLNDIRYVDDDRIVKFGTPTVGVSAFGMRTGQAYPYWWPIYKDGASAIAPYDFNDPAGPPAYNYYLTYQVPGDPNHYKVETVAHGAMQRFADSGKPAWYSITGDVPDVNDPNERQYFITNSEPWYPSIESSGIWTQYQDLPANRDNSQYFKENYVYNAAGSGNDYTRFMFKIPTAGQYKVEAWWPGLSDNTTSAPFRIYHASGSTLRTMNQTINGRRWNDLGTYTFDAGDYSVLLTDAVSSGNVVADGVRVGHISNPSDVVQSDFIAVSSSFPAQITPCGPAPLNVMFVNAGTGDLTGREWDLGDGYKNTTRDMLYHEYVRPGVYTISLTVKGPLGNSTKTKTGYIVVWPEGTTQTLPLMAEFACLNKFNTMGTYNAPVVALFQDASRGENITGWLWNFGDGQTSDEQNPMHIYAQPGNYTISLTVTNSLGQTHTETKPNYLRVVQFEKNIDNVDYPKTSYGGWVGKTMLKTKSMDIPKDQMKYARILLESCNSGDYYIQSIARGLAFYTVGSSTGEGSLAYLQSYLQGKTDQEIWETVQQVQALYDYYNFNLTPSDQQTMVKTTPIEPEVLSISAEQQAEIEQMKTLSMIESFEILSGPEYIVNEGLCSAAISEVYDGSEYEAVELALARVKTPIETTDNTGVRELKTAKSILAEFSDISIPRLTGLYPHQDVSINANIITTAGPLAGDSEIFAMLIEALDDKTETIDANPEMIGKPLRICDIAYNQIVLNLNIKDVLRTIGTGMTEDVRDYHIDILKNKL
ncbi:MAG: hypothetical protein A2Y10_03400 [Planctomycetes bacterium GWF2_41_51]|nr:MAG: hypothetical protein A2Y10_03400 [Planctomycetes bacterium GWF2_41_51]HBG28290.1 hypothetical protein [Phycisphaerales bacterium]